MIVLIVTLMTISTFLNVVMRYIFDSPILFYEELVLLLFVWLVGLGLPVCYQKKNLISVEIFDQETINQKLDLVCDLAILIFICIFAYLSLMFAVQSTGKITSVLRIPYFYIDISFTIGSFLTLAEVIDKHWRKT